MSDNLFVVKNKGDLHKLREWLTEKRFNTFIETKDSTDQQLFGLIWDDQLGSFPSLKRMDRGAVVVKQKYLIKMVAIEIINKMIVESEFGKYFRKSKMDLWKFGKQ